MTTIIVVDDDPEMRDMLRFVLEDAGHTVADYANGRGAIDHVKRNSVDLVITDIFMPETDGLETIRQIRSLRPALPIVAISGVRFHGMDYLNAAKNFGAFGILRKPFSMADLLDLLDELLDRAAR